MDTANDFRLRLAEKGLKELEKIIQAVKVQRRKEILKEIRNMQSEMQTIKYCYLSPEEIVELENFKNLVEKAKEIRETLKGAEKDYNWKLADYWLEYISYLPMLMERGEITKPWEAIRFFSGEITARKSLGSLWLCNVDCGFRLDVVTNSDEFKPNTYVVVAYLPPREFGDIVSEGMFVKAEMKKKGELSIDEIRSIAGSLGEVESIIIELIS